MFKDFDPACIQSRRLFRELIYALQWEHRYLRSQRVSRGRYTLNPLQFDSVFCFPKLLLNIYSTVF